MSHDSKEEPASLIDALILHHRKKAEQVPSGPDEGDFVSPTKTLSKLSSRDFTETSGVLSQPSRSGRLRSQLLSGALASSDDDDDDDNDDDGVQEQQRGEQDKESQEREEQEDQEQLEQDDDDDDDDDDVPTAAEEVLDEDLDQSESDVNDDETKLGAPRTGDSFAIPTTSRARSAPSLSGKLQKRHGKRKGTSRRNIRVVVRCRPTNVSEEGDQVVVSIPDGKHVVLDDPSSQLQAKRKKKKKDKRKPDASERKVQTRFSFDHAFGPEAGQDEVYGATAKGLVAHVMDGNIGTVFAYGPTGTGKTHTMMGSGDTTGVTLMSLRDLFAAADASPHRCDIKLQFVEIYNERILDLLASDSTREPVSIRDDPASGVVLDGVVEPHVTSTQEVMTLLASGNQRRVVDSHRLNQASSRSHAILQVTVKQYLQDSVSKTEVLLKSGSFNLIDLAGSERLKKTHARSSKLRKEGANINKSLLALANCINALSQKKKGLYVPFRDSKLTRLLKSSLSGMSRTWMIACFAPTASQWHETRETLRYAHRAATITTKPQRQLNNRVLDVQQYEKLVTKLRKEVEVLKRAFTATKSPQPVAVSPLTPDTRQVTWESPTGPADDEARGGLFTSLRDHIIGNAEELANCKREFAELREHDSTNRERLADLDNNILRWFRRTFKKNRDIESAEHEATVLSAQELFEIRSLEDFFVPNNIKQDLEEKDQLNAAQQDNSVLQAEVEERIATLQRERQSLKARVSGLSDADLRAERLEVLHTIIDRTAVELVNSEMELQLRIMERVVQKNPALSRQVSQEVQDALPAKRLLQAMGTSNRHLHGLLTMSSRSDLDVGADTADELTEPTVHAESAGLVSLPEVTEHPRDRDRKQADSGDGVPGDQSDPPTPHPLSRPTSDQLPVLAPNNTPDITPNISRHTSLRGEKGSVGSAARRNLNHELESSESAEKRQPLRSALRHTTVPATPEGSGSLSAAEDTRGLLAAALSTFTVLPTPPLSDEDAKHGVDDETDSLGGTLPVVPAVSATSVSRTSNQVTLESKVEFASEPRSPIPALDALRFPPVPVKVLKQPQQSGGASSARDTKHHRRLSEHSHEEKVGERLIDDWPSVNKDSKHVMEEEEVDRSIELDRQRIALQQAQAHNAALTESLRTAQRRLMEAERALAGHGPTPQQRQLDRGTRALVSWMVLLTVYECYPHFSAGYLLVMGLLVLVLSFMNRDRPGVLQDLWSSMRSVQAVGDTVHAVLVPEDVDWAKIADDTIRGVIGRTSSGPVAERGRRPTHIEADEKLVDRPEHQPDASTVAAPVSPPAIAISQSQPTTVAETVTLASRTQQDESEADAAGCTVGSCPCPCFSSHEWRPRLCRECFHTDTQHSIVDAGLQAPEPAVRHKRVQSSPALPIVPVSTVQVAGQTSLRTMSWAVSPEDGGIQTAARRASSQSRSKRRRSKTRRQREKRGSGRQPAFSRPRALVKHAIGVSSAVVNNDDYGCGYPDTSDDAHKPQ